MRKRRSLKLLTLLMLFVSFGLQLHATIELDWTNSNQFNIEWDQNKAAYKITVRYFDYGSNNEDDMWISRGVVGFHNVYNSIPSLSLNKLFAIDSRSQSTLASDGNEVRIKSLIPASMGHICVASYTVPWQVLEYQDTICLNKSSDISAANKWYTFKYKNPQGNSVAYAAEIYWYPNEDYLNKNYYLTITGEKHRQNQSNSSRAREGATITAPSSPVYLYDADIRYNSHFIRDNGNYYIQGYVRNLDKYSYSEARATLQTSTNNSNWNDKNFRNCKGGDRWINFDITDCFEYKSGSTRYTDQEFADGIYVRTAIVACPDGNIDGTGSSPYRQYNYTSSVRTLPIAVIKQNSFKVQQDNRTLNISWNMVLPTNNPTNQKTDDFILELKNSSGGWVTVNNITFVNNQINYSTTYELSSSEINKGNVNYEFRIRRSCFAEGVLSYYLSATNTISVITDYKKPTISEATQLPGSTTVQITIDKGTGIWDVNASLYLAYNGNEVAVNADNTSFTVGSLAACTTYDFELKAKLGQSLYYTSPMKSCELSSLNARTIRNYEVSKGYYNDNVTLKWEVPADSSDFSYFSIERVPIGSTNGLLLAQIEHKGLVNYSYQDRDMEAGVYYNYKIKGYSVCNNKLQGGTELSSEGFCQPYAVVSGRIAYDGNQGVQGVTVSALSGDDNNQNSSVFFNGSTNSYGILPASLNLIDNNNVTFQSWVYPNYTKTNTNTYILSSAGLMTLFLNSSKQLSVVVAGRTALFNNVVFPANEWSQLSVACNYNSTSAEITVYLNGVLIQTQTISGITVSTLQNNKTKDYYLGCSNTLTSFNGVYLDEIRFWDMSLDSALIKSNYDRFITGKENNLKAYYRCDEMNIGKLFDLSAIGRDFNKNDGKLATGATHTYNVPSKDQLSIKATTDIDGNYLINTLPYTTEGLQYNVVPTMGIHSFNPSKQPIYASHSSNVFNNISFTDVSSFAVSGVVYYEGTNYPVEGASLYIDGLVCSKDGEAITTKSDGTFEISVPIGDHHITVKKNGHTFVNNGRYPEDPSDVGIKHTFNQEISNLRFLDNTLVTVAGKVVGGQIESSKPLGLGLSSNNIGSATITLTSGTYRMNVVDSISGTTSVMVNNRDNVTIASPTDDVKSISYRKGGDSDDTKEIVITTDPETGEFAVLLPPVSYSISSVVINSNKDIEFSSTSFPILHANNPLMILTDSVELEDGSVKKFNYNASYIETYYSDPVFTVSDASNNDGAFGEQYFYYQDLMMPNPDTLLLYEVRNDSILYPYSESPIFIQNNFYNFKIKAFENYINKEKNNAETIVPLKNTVVAITNAMSSSQQVYIQDGVTEDGEEVTAGEIKNLAVNEIELDDNGEATYRWMAGFPNIINDYTLGLTMTYSINNRVYNWDKNGLFNGIVLGNLPSGNNFVTSGPDKVLMILRDPPGTNSSAYWEENSTYTTQQKEGSAFVTNNDIITKTKLGVILTTISGTPGFGIITEVGSQSTLEVGVKINSKRIDSETIATTLSTSKRISTSDGFDFVGAQGDVFIGAATNIIFGNARQVGIQKDTLGNYSIIKEDVITTGSEFSTDFHYSTNYIEETLIPNLLLSRNSLLTQVTQAYYDSVEYSPTDAVIYITTLSEDDAYGRYGSSNIDSVIWGNLANRDKSLTYGPSYKMLLPENRSPQEAYQDMVLWYNEQVKGWENTMSGNEQAKIKAIEDSKTWKDKNISFDSGAKIESSTKTCTGQTIDMEWEIETLVVLGYETGFEINKTGVGLTTRTETGGTAIHSESSSSEYCNEIGYILAEDGDDDALTVDVFRAPDGFGAIFSTLGGQTCCPYEGEVVSKYYNPGTQLSAATMRIEWPEILPISQTVTDVPSGKSANFTLVLNNLSETNEDVWFTLAMLDETNPNGAQLSIDGAKLTDGRDILVRANETLTKSLQLTQTSLDVLEYKDIKIVLKSKCQADPTGVHEVIADTATLSAYFVPTCSDITLNIENRIINARSSDTLSMQILDLDRTFDNFKYVRIQYKGLSDVNWSLAKEYAVNSSDVDSNNELLPSGGRINYQLPMSNTSLFPDQTYLFRAITVCSFGIETVINESETIEVIKDMSIPQVLGTPAPSNGILEVGDDISLTFNETIRSTSLSKDDNFIVTGILNDAQIAHDVAFTLEGTATPAVTAADIRLSNQSFAFDVWVNYNGEGTLFSHGNGQNKFVVNITNENKMEVIIGQSSYISTLTIPQNKWIFITLNYLYDAQIPRLSVMFADDDMTQMLFNSLSVNSYEGHGAISIGNNLQGAIHELTLWNRARTVVEAQAAMYSSKAPSTPNLIGYWKFNEGKGSVAQDYARNRHMALSHENWYLNNENKAISLDGSSYLLLDIAKYSVNNEESYAFEMWFRGTAQSDTATLFSIGTNKLALLFAPNGNMVLQGNGVTHSITSENYLDNIWHHVALNVLRNGNAIVYVDGINVNQLDAALVPAMAGSHIVIGASGNRLSINTINYNKYFAGEVDEIRLWNATLTGEFLRNNSNVRLTGNNNGLVAYYPFEHQTLDANNQVITIGSLKDQAYHINDSIVTNATSNNAIVYASTAPAMIKAPAETNLKYSFVASDNTIVINLLDKASYLEQSTVNVTVYDVRDLANNLSQSISWKVYVNKNQLKWSDEEIAIKQLSTESETFTTSITNQSGLSEVWSITNMPSWLSADVSQGTLAALSSRNINFTVSPSTPIGVYEGIVYLSGTNQIYEPLIITLHVTGEEPIWDVDPSLYETSMNIIGQMQVVGLVSEDVNDKIAAFIDGECVGVASPVYYSRYDSYYVIMDVYGNSNLLGKEVKFKVWDASTGIVYPSVNTSSAVTYNANQLLGNMKNPFIWNAEDKIEQNVDLSSGWNWTSLYMTATDMSVPSLMQSIKSQVMVVKGKTSFTQPTAQGWAGSLSALEVGKMYKVQMSEQANLSMNGKAVDATTTPLTIYPNWNWIGYNASYNVSIADAFAGLDPEDGDQVKGQSGFALYQDYEWIGTLKTLIPGKGYMYQSQATTNKSFAYPSSEFASKAPQRTPRVQGVFNPVAENVYSGNMTMVALVKNNDEIISNCEVGVFSNDECRAAEMANENGLVFLTIAGEGSGLRLNFRVSINGTIHQIEKGIIYIDDSSIGTLDNPHIIQLVATDIQDIITENILVYPTVVSDKVFVESMYYEIQNIKLIDVNGRLIQSFDSNLKQRHEIDMTTCSEGVYLIIVDVNDGQQFIQKVVKTTNK